MTKYITVKLTEDQANFIGQLLYQYCEGEQKLSPRKSFAYRIANTLAQAKNKVTS